MSPRNARHLVAILVTIATAALLALAAGPAAGQGTTAPETAAYDLGVTTFAQPGAAGRFAGVPIRLWGAVGVPAGDGPAPVVVVAHGAHGDGCPGEFGDWPCFAVEQRNDLGLRYLVRALARAGLVAVAPDLNVAHTGGFGEIAGAAENQRANAVIDATLLALATASAGGPSAFPVPLAGRADATRVGVIGHSRGGMNVLDWASRHPDAVKGVVLLAPYFEPAERVPDVPTTLILGTCDRDTGTEGAGYLKVARAGARTAPSWRLVVRGATHNAYNRTLVAIRNDDAVGAKGACSRARRARPGAQQAFLAQVARDAMAQSLLGAAPAAWQQPGARSGPLHGLRVALSADLRG